MGKNKLKRLIETFLEDNNITIEAYDDYDGEDKYIGTNFYFEKDGVEINIREII